MLKPGSVFLAIEAKWARVRPGPEKTLIWCDKSVAWLIPQNPYAKYLCGGVGASEFHAGVESQGMRHQLEIYD